MPVTAFSEPLCKVEVFAKEYSVSLGCQKKNVGLLVSANVTTRGFQKYALN